MCIKTLTSIKSHTFVPLIICILFHATSFAQERKFRPAKEPYASLSLAEKNKVQDKLVSQLKIDKDFLAMQKDRKQIVDEMMAAKKKERASGASDKKLDPATISKYKDHSLKSMSTLINLMRKYPSLQQLDSETFKSVLKRASAKQ